MAGQYERSRAGEGGGSQRLDSLDLARGVLILLVIFVHAYGHNYAAIAGSGTISKVWDLLVSIAKPIRMPAFFLISGFLAKSLVKKDWGVLLKSRVLFLMYMYAVWLFINLTVGEYLGHLEGSGQFSIREVVIAELSKLVMPYSFLWFLWALSLYNVLAKATLRLPLWAVLGAGFIISGLSEQLTEQPSYILRCGVYFLLGARCPEIVSAISKRATWKFAAGLAAAYVAAVGLIIVLGQKFPGVWLPAGLIGSAAIIMTATLVSAYRALDGLKYLGRNTLQLYVLHPMVISILTSIEMRSSDGMVVWLRGSPIVLAAYPIVFVAMVTVVALAIWAVLTRIGLGILFRAPWGQPKGRDVGKNSKKVGYDEAPDLTDAEFEPARLTARVERG